MWRIVPGNASLKQILRHQARDGFTGEGCGLWMLTGKQKAALRLPGLPKFEGLFGIRSQISSAIHLPFATPANEPEVGPDE